MDGKPDDADQADRPDVAPAEDPPQPGGAAVAPASVPDVAPVGDPRPAYGFELAKILLLILSSAIALFWLYLVVLDAMTSWRVDNTYDKILSLAEPGRDSAEQRKLEAVTEVFRAIQTRPTERPAPEVATEVARSIEQIDEMVPLSTAQAARLRACAGALKADPVAAEAGDREARPRQIDAAPCIRILESLRFAAGGPIDADRLRVLRDFAKDVHDNHQGLRTFWISAAQLVLVNVLLPLLTALLGYIFGRQSSSN